MQPQHQGGVQASGDFDSLEDLEPLSPTALSGIRVPSALALGRMEGSSTVSGSIGLPALPMENPEEARAASSAERTKKTRMEDIESRAQSLPVELAEGERRESGTSEPYDKAREKNRRNQRTFRQRQKAKAQQQEEELTTANSRVAELQEQVTVLQQLLAADTGPSSTGGLSLPAPGETSLQARIRASSSALQLDRALVLVKEGRLQSLIQQHLEEERAPLPTSLPLSARSLAAFDQPFSHANLIAARKQHLQSFQPGPGWNECTPAPMEQLYSAILEGRLDLRLPLANGQIPDRSILLSRLVAMEAQQHVRLQAQYHACLAQAAPFCEDPQSSHSKHFQAVMGEAMALLAVFAECLPEQFLASQSINMLDGISKMPPPAFEALKAASLRLQLDANQAAAAQVLYDTYVQQAANANADRQQLLGALQMRSSTTAPATPELSTPNMASTLLADMQRLQGSYALQQEAYMHLLRSFVLRILTPMQAGLLAAASYPFLAEFPAVLEHIVSRSRQP